MSLYENQKCPVCGVAFKSGDDIVTCPECGTPHHRQCYEKSGNAQMLPFILQVLCIKELRSLILRISSRQISSK